MGGLSSHYMSFELISSWHRTEDSFKYGISDWLLCLTDLDLSTCLFASIPLTIDAYTRNWFYIDFLSAGDFFKRDGRYCNIGGKVGQVTYRERKK